MHTHTHTRETHTTNHMHTWHTNKKSEAAQCKHTHAFSFQHTLSAPAVLTDTLHLRRLSVLMLCRHSLTSIYPQNSYEASLCVPCQPRVHATCTSLNSTEHTCYFIIAVVIGENKNWRLRLCLPLRLNRMFARCCHLCADLISGQLALWVCVKGPPSWIFGNCYSFLTFCRYVFFIQHQLCAV